MQDRKKEFWIGFGIAGVSSLVIAVVLIFILNF